MVPERRAIKCAGCLTIVLAGTYVPITEYPAWGGPCLYQYFKVFKEGDTKDMVNLIQHHESIISDKKLHAKYSTYVGLLSDNNTEFNTLKAKLKKISKD